MTAINKNFIVKNGLQVGEDLIVSNETTNRVGIASTVPTHTLSVGGDIFADQINIAGVSTLSQLKGTQVSYTQVDAGNLYASVGVVTALTGSNIDVTGELKSTRLAIGVAGSIFSATSSGVGVGTTIPTKDFEVVGDVNVTGAISATVINSDINSVGVSTFAIADVEELEITNVNILGISTLGIAEATRLNVSGNTTLGITTTGPLDVAQINVVGVTTIGNLGVTQLNVTGFSTFSDRVGADDIFANTIDTGNLRATGITTLSTTSTNSLSATQLSVTGVSTLAGITTVTGSTLFSKQLNVSGVATVGSLNVATIAPTSVNTTDISASGVGTFGTIKMADSAQILLGNSSDLLIHHNGSNSIIADQGTGGLYLAGDNDVVITNAALSETKAKFTSNGSAELYYDNAVSVATSSYGIFVPGVVGIASAIPAGNLDVVGNVYVRGTITGDGFSGPGIVTDIVDGAGSVAVEVTPGVYKIDLYGSAVGEAWGTVLNGSGEIGVRTDVLVGVGTTVPPEYTLDVFAKYEEEAARFLVQGSNLYAPFIVNSNVLVSNLNAQFLNGKSAPSGSIVGTTDSQTLTNKTLTLPTIQGTGANFSGSTSGTTTLKASATAGTTTITLPATTGTVVTTGDSGTVTSTMIANSTITNTDISASAAIAYSKLSLTGSIVNADINASAAIAVSKLAASTISGVSLGSNLSSLTIGAYMTQNGQTYNGSAAKTVAVDADSANTASKVVVRDGSGNFSAGTITANLTGTASNATLAATITVADESSDTSCNLLYVTQATGSLAAKTGTNLTFNSNSGQLTCHGLTAILASSTIGTLKTMPLMEGVNVVAGTANGTTNIDVLTSNVWVFTTNATANWTHNIRGDASNSLNNTMAIGDSIVVTILAKKNSTTHYATDITIDGGAQTELWLGGAAPTAGLSGSNYDMYTWTIIKTASATFTVLASQSQYGA